jgi:hypothetical protein
MRRAEMGGLTEAMANESALTPKSEDLRRQQAKMPQLGCDKRSDTTVTRRAIAQVAATHRARSANPNSVSFPV